MSKETTIRKGVYTRQQFLDKIEVNEDDCDEIREKSMELVEFISSLEMGDYYSKQIKKLIPLHSVVLWVGDYIPDRREANCKYRQTLIDNKNKIQSLLVELLSSQSWADENKTYNIKGDLVMGDKPAGDKVGRDKIL